MLLKFGVGRTRRSLVGGAFAMAGLWIAGPALAARPQRGVRKIALYNVHTDERERLAYWEDGNYVPDAMRRIEHLLRDHYSDEVHTIDPRLIDVLSALTHKLETYESVDVVSGYRSKATNAKLAREMRGVSKESLHIQGMAVDITLQNRDLVKVRDAALGLRSGGVGYYPQHGFLHVDVGPVRSWGPVAAVQTTSPKRSSREEGPPPGLSPSSPERRATKFPLG